MRPLGAFALGGRLARTSVTSVFVRTGRGAGRTRPSGSGRVCWGMAARVRLPSRRRGRLPRAGGPPRSGVMVVERPPAGPANRGGRGGQGRTGAGMAQWSRRAGRRGGNERGDATSPALRWVTDDRATAHRAGTGLAATATRRSSAGRRAGQAILPAGAPSDRDQATKRQRGSTGRSGVRPGPPSDGAVGARSPRAAPDGRPDAASAMLARAGHPSPAPIRRHGRDGADARPRYETRHPPDAAAGKGEMPRGCRSPQAGPYATYQGRATRRPPRRPRQRRTRSTRSAGRRTAQDGRQLACAPATRRRPGHPPVSPP